MFAANFDGIVCPEGQECVVQTFPDRNVTFGQCITTATNSTQLMSSCEIMSCPPQNTCVDLRMGDVQVTGQCLTTGCADSIGTSTPFCEQESTCEEIPKEFEMGIESICIPLSAQFQFGTKTCAQSGRQCPSPSVCQEAFIDNLLVGTLCNVNQLSTNCVQLDCLEDQECMISTIPTNLVPSRASYLQSTNILFILQLLEELGIIPTTPTVSASTEFLSTTSPTVNSTDCPFDCSLIGETCEIVETEFESGIATCVSPKTCTEKLSSFCLLKDQACREVIGSRARCDQPKNCEEFVCPNGTICVMITSNLTGIAVAIPKCHPIIQVGRTCEDNSCREDEMCIVNEYEKREVVFSECLPIADLPPLALVPPTCKTLDCGPRNRSCVLI